MLAVFLTFGHRPSLRAEISVASPFRRRSTNGACHVVYARATCQLDHDHQRQPHANGLADDFGEYLFELICAQCFSSLYTTHVDVLVRSIESARPTTRITNDSSPQQVLRICSCGNRVIPSSTAQRNTVQVKLCKKLTREINSAFILVGRSHLKLILIAKMKA